MDALWYNGLEPLWRMIVVGVFSYVALILLLRAAGKRTLSRMNAYDMVITMALGSILAKVLLSKENSISESICAIALLIALQYGVSILMRRCPRFRRIISSEPRVLFHDGQYIESAMKKERVDKEEIEAAMHEKGLSDMGPVQAVVLGTNGHLSVLFKPEYVNTLKAGAGSLNESER